MRKHTKKYNQKHLRLVKFLGIGLIVMSLAIPAVKVYEKHSSAAANTVSAEAEAGTPAGSAATLSSSSASSGQAVVFGNTGGGGSGSCIAPAGLKKTDIVSASQDSPILPWPHKLGGKALIYFTTSGIPAEYAGYLQVGADIWNASPCIDIQLVASCPASGNCVKSRMGSVGGGDASFTENENNSYLTGGTMVMDESELSRESVAYKKVVIGHEMGHAVSLNHRLTKTDIMYAGSDERAALKADSINLDNILAVYGVASGATSAQAQSYSGGPAIRQRTMR